MQLKLHIACFLVKNIWWNLLSIEFVLGTLFLFEPSTVFCYHFELYLPYCFFFLLSGTTLTSSKRLVTIPMNQICYQATQPTFLPLKQIIHHNDNDKIIIQNVRSAHCKMFKKWYRINWKESTTLHLGIYYEWLL